METSLQTPSTLTLNHVPKAQVTSIAKLLQIKKEHLPPGETFTISIGLEPAGALTPNTVTANLKLKEKSKLTPAQKAYALLDQIPVSQTLPGEKNTTELLREIRDQE